MNVSELVRWQWQGYPRYHQSRFNLLLHIIVVPLFLVGNLALLWVLRVHDLSGSVARQLSGRHSAPKGARDETNGIATGDPEDEIRRNV